MEKIILNILPLLLMNALCALETRMLRLPANLVAKLLDIIFAMLHETRMWLINQNAILAKDILRRRNWQGD